MVRTYNVEAGLPTLDDARRLVIAEIKRARREGVRVLEVIQGYGSSGKGGALCVGLRKSFGLPKKEGVIKDSIAGEDFSIFNETVLALLEAVPEMRGAPDSDATNEGISLLWLKQARILGESEWELRPGRLNARDIALRHEEVRRCSIVPRGNDRLVVGSEHQ